MKIGKQILKFLWRKLILNRDFALAREILDDHENAQLSNILPDHEEFVSGMSLMSFLATITKCREFKIFAGKYLPPLHEIFVQEIPIQKCF